MAVRVRGPGRAGVARRAGRRRRLVVSGRVVRVTASRGRVRRAARGRGVGHRVRVRGRVRERRVARDRRTPGDEHDRGERRADLREATADRELAAGLVDLGADQHGEQPDERETDAAEEQRVRPARQVEDPFASGPRRVIGVAHRVAHQPHARGDATDAEHPDTDLADIDVHASPRWMPVRSDQIVARAE